MSPRARPNVIVSLIITVGLGLRALIPAGYMPGSLEGDTWFTLCPSTLPAGFTAVIASGKHQHHGMHGENAGNNVLSGDCSFGHILSGALISAESADASSQMAPSTSSLGGFEQLFVSETSILRPRSRAPPLRSAVSIAI